ncbi:MAG: nucleotidyl transferase, partial [Anaerolineae bacterium]
ETIFAVDNTGQSLNGIDLCATMAELALQAKPGRAIAVSVNLPHIFEEIADRHNGRVIRTGIEPNALMAACLAAEVVMAGDGKGNFIFPEFQPCVDGLMAIAKLLEFLATQNRQLSDVITHLPPYYLSQAKVYCLWEVKGSVMRKLSQKFEDKLADTVEGVKVRLSEEEWVLILPSQDQPHIEVIAEAASQSVADGIVEEYTRLVRALQPQNM